ncbi:MAG TPA: hypothetical protein VFZ31_06325 [Vicinamibacterales bacterium]
MRNRLRLRRIVLAAGLSSLVLTIACWPTSRFVGVDYVVSEQRLPLWLKVMEFVDRDINFANAAEAVLGGIEGDEAKAEAALAWTRANIKPAPPGLPIVDDHIWNILIRGYGQSDQQADVFTTLLAYQDVPAYWMLIGAKPREIPISYVWIRDRWRVYDVTRGLAFRNAAGELATPEEIAADHDLIRAAARGFDADGYLAHFAGYTAPIAPDVLRADLQMPGRRVWHETRKMFGRHGRTWQMRSETVPTRAEVSTP